MRLAQATVTIDAPIDLVWSVMLDLPAYREWNPFIYRARRSGGETARVGDDILLHVKFSSGRRFASPERITAIDAPAGGKAVLEYEFRGPLHVAGLIRGRRRQELQEAGGSTLYRTSENFRGLIGFTVSVAAVQDGFERHAAALKQRAESLKHV
jgi:hypothetical protein